MHWSEDVPDMDFSSMNFSDPVTVSKLFVEEPQLGGKVFKDGFASLAATEEEAPFQLSTRLNDNRIKFANVREHHQEMQTWERAHAPDRSICASNPRSTPSSIAKQRSSSKSMPAVRHLSRPQRKLPEKPLQTPLKLRHCLNQAAKGTLTMLGQSVIVSPPVRKS
ncbi:hypothetical protein LX32DRAFT_684218 [Colletotrichum zoysiae]|uniref:Uncharacterized protein n=1 Tax=Colletotrichum zoysiae TaxID=1216348 RepID=A0AAD9HDC6_9PEZI|nr:hypothetical protein LX32DRAFT_684218 [Colletotrichum zoysiae]